MEQPIHGHGARSAVEIVEMVLLVLPNTCNLLHAEIPNT